MYKNIKILNPKEHGFYRYTSPTDLYYAKDLNLIPVTFSEVKMLCCEYPIVIMIENEIPKLMLMTGLQSNGAIDEKGKWKGSYMPSFLKRYPFTLVQAESEEALHIGFDLESGLFSSPEGRPLFDQEGTPTAILENMKKLLTAFQQEAQITKNILTQLKEKELLQETHFTFKKEDGEEQKVGGFFIIDKKKLLEQEDDFLLEAVKNGWMEMIELHHLSLKNTQKLNLR